MNTKLAHELQNGDVFNRAGSSDKFKVTEMLGTERSSYTDEMGTLFTETITSIDVLCKFGPNHMHMNPEEVVVIIK